MSSRDDDRPVGYGKTPPHTRYPKGRSGYAGRKKGRQGESTVAIIDRLLLETMVITINGKPTKVTTLEAIISGLQQKEFAGSIQASRVLMKYQEFAARNASRRLNITFVDNEYTAALARRPRKD